ncbi:hypothetical protein ZHAS_00013339 [Anopheles sinensis]|uniref:Secreted protein n=1 Tax=Anopheles sinensis TaxID=74873 RepID=A0A084W5B5_ANOSI|nr:hypothetical protein ZHAS_00013339 [Anopheles sinensis]
MSLVQSKGVCVCVQLLPTVAAVRHMGALCPGQHRPFGQTMVPTPLQSSSPFDITSVPRLAEIETDHQCALFVSLRQCVICAVGRVWCWSSMWSATTATTTTPRPTLNENGSLLLHVLLADLPFRAVNAPIESNSNVWHLVCR